MLDAISDSSVLLNETPRKIVFNETFENYNNGSDATPIWNPENGNWTVIDGFYTGSQKNWIVRPSFLSDYSFSDFSIKTDPDKYEKSLQIDKEIAALLEEIEQRIAQSHKETKEKFKTVKGIAIHNPEKGKAVIEEFVKKLQ